MLSAGYPLGVSPAPQPTSHDAEGITRRHAYWFSQTSFSESRVFAVSC
jgi:hypothetical protein